MTGTFEFFLLTERQRQAWIAIMGNANFPTSREAMMEALRPMWEGIQQQQDAVRILLLMEDAIALGLYEGAPDGKSLAKESMYVRRPRTTSAVAANDDASSATDKE